MSNLDEKDFTCANSCDLSYESEGKKYSRKVWHKLLGSGVDHWDCPDCTDNCGVNWNTRRFMNLDEIVAEQVMKCVRAKGLLAGGHRCVIDDESDFLKYAYSMALALQDVLGILDKNFMNYDGIKLVAVGEIRQAISNRLEETK